MDFWENYVRLCAKEGRSPTAVGLAVGVNKSSVTGWSRGAMPRYATLVRVADHFGVTVKELLGEEEAAEEKSVDTQKENLVSYLEDMRTMGVLFDVARGASKEEIQKFAKVIAAIRGVNLE